MLEAFIYQKTFFINEMHFSVKLFAAQSNSYRITYGFIFEFHHYTHTPE